MQYIACAFLDEYNVGDTLIDWPLHITLVTWFYVDESKDLIESLELALHDVEHIDTTVGDERVWGPNTVNVLDKSSSFQNLHTTLLGQITTHGNLLTNARFMGANYTPHITHQGTLAAQPGQSVSIKHVYILQKDANHRLKTILGKIDLV